MRLGDLDALKEEIKKCVPYVEQERILDIIDNAPPLPQVTVFAENASKEEIEDFKQELEKVLERPQGKWISDYRKCKCSVCNFTTVIDTYNFCPICGADMRGDKNEVV